MSKKLVGKYLLLLPLVLLVSAQGATSIAHEEKEDKTSSKKTLHSMKLAYPQIPSPISRIDTEDLSGFEDVPLVYSNRILVFHDELSATCWHISKDYFDVGAIVLQATALLLQGAQLAVSSGTGLGNAAIGCQLGAILCSTMHHYAMKKAPRSAQQAIDMRKLYEARNAEKVEQKDSMA